MKKTYRPQMYTFTQIKSKYVYRFHLYLCKNLLMKATSLGINFRFSVATQEPCV